MNEFLIKLIANGGPGSGNHNPGQGRGVGKPANGNKGKAGKFSKDEEVLIKTSLGDKLKGKIIRKLSDKEKKDRAFLANPDAGDYYEVEHGSGEFKDKTIVWEGNIEHKTIKKVDVMFDVPDKYEKDIKSYMDSPKYKEKCKKLLDAKNKEKEAQRKIDAAKKLLEQTHGSPAIKPKYYLDKVDSIRKEKEKSTLEKNKAIEERKSIEKEIAQDAMKSIKKDKGSLTASIGKTSSEDEITIIIKEK